MARFIVFILAAAAIFFLLYLLFQGVLHTLIIGFWIALIALLGYGLLRIGRWSRSRQ